MKAFVYDGEPGVKDVKAPVPDLGEALIRIRLAGICKTDLEIMKGYMDFRGTLGHEFVGVVQSSSNTGLIGKRVVGDINLGCRKCDLCLRGMERHCASRSTLGIYGKDGVFAEYVTLPESNLHPVADNISDEAAVFTEPLAAALEILEQIHVEPNTDVLIIGDGRLALLICMVLRLTGCSITVMGKHSSKLAMFGRYSAHTVLIDAVEMMNRKFDLVVEASGSQSGWHAAIKSVKPRGKIALKSTYHGDLNFNPAPLVIDEISVIGSRCGQFDPALRLLELGLVNPLELITEVFTLDEAIKAFHRAAQPDSLKILIRC